MFFRLAAISLTDWSAAWYDAGNMSEEMADAQQELEALHRSMALIQERLVSLHRAAQPVKKEFKNTRTEVQLLAGALDGPGSAERPPLARSLDNVAGSQER